MSERGRDALAQCMHLMFKTSDIYHIGYRKMADRLADALDERGFKVISHATYRRLREMTETNRRKRPYRARLG